MKMIIGISEINDMVIAKYSKIKKDIPKGILSVRTKMNKEQTALIFDIEKINEDEL